jgi:hypothetical protein
MTDPTPGGWPDAARPGYPKNPCVTGPHQITHASPDWPTKGPWVLLWCAEEELWTDLFGNREPPAAMAHHRYLGPCHTPAEVAALTEWRDEPPGGISKGGVLYLSPERVAAQVEAARREEREANAAGQRGERWAWEVRPKQMDREKTLRRWVQATSREGER